MKVTVEYDVESNTLSLTSADPEIDKVTVIRAVYDEDGALTGVRLYTAVFENMSSEITDITISENEKIFVWRDFSDNNGGAMTPLSEVFML